MTSEDLPHVPWTRYWFPQGTDAPKDRDGYLRDPRLHGVAGGRAATLASLHAVPCAILLGEPGAGKTTELAQLDDAHAVRIDLGAVGGEAGFYRALTDAPALLAWKQSGAPLHLVVDAYDEAALHVANAARLLADAVTGGLSSSPAVRAQRAAALSLRVSSRAGDWPLSATRAFQKLWGPDAVQTLHLAPLCRSDVVLAAEQMGLNGEAFLAAVSDHQAGAWASLPLTLLWLLGLRRRGARFPDTRARLFHNGALLLCREHNEGRGEARVRGLLEPEQRLAVAARVAALMRVAERATLSLRSDPPEGALAASDVFGSEPLAHAGPLTVGRAELEDTVRNTGLFQSTGPDTYRWTQEAIADFLAAWYLTRRGLAPAQLASLITSPADGRVPARARGIAGWIASLSPETFLRVSPLDPHVVLDGDPQSLPPSDRAQAVDDLLTAVDTGALSPYHDGIGPLRGLDHPHLFRQLVSWIDDASRSVWARREAVWIGSQSRCQRLAPVLLNRALRADVPASVRVAAIHALSNLDRPEGLEHLRTLALAPGEEASSLRSAARSALWPADLSFLDLAASVALGQDDAVDRVSCREAFTRHEVPDDQILGALAWATSSLAATAPALVEPVVLAAVSRIDVPAFATAVARLLVGLANDDLDVAGHLDSQAVQKAFREPDNDPSPDDRMAFRQALVTEALATGLPSALELTQIRFRPFRLEDAASLVEMLLAAEAAADDIAADAIADTLGFLVPPFEGAPDPVRHVLDRAAVRSARAARLVYWQYGPWSLDDPEVQRVQASWKRVRSVPENPPVPTVAYQVAAALDAHSDNPSAAWRRACYTLALDPENAGMYFENVEYHHDLSRSRAWETLDEPLRDRLALAAEAYLLSDEPGEDDWTTFEAGAEETYCVLDARKAVWLLAGHARDRLDALPESVWRAWAPALLLRPVGGRVEDAALYRDVVARAYHADPAQFAAHLARALPLVGHSGSALVHAVDDLADARVSGLLCDALVEGMLGASAAAEAADALARRSHAPTLGWLAEQTHTAEIGDAVAAAVLLLREHPVWAWTAISARFAADDAFARSLLGRLASQRRNRLHDETPDTALVALERALGRLFPPADDPPDPESGHARSAAHLIRHARGSFAARLVQKGTPEALGQIASLRSVLGDSVTDDYLDAGRKALRDAAYGPLAPAAVLALAERTDARLARSPDELFAVVVETLLAFEAWLRTGDAPRVDALWNRVSRSEALRMAASIARSEESTLGRTADSPIAERLDALRTRRRANPVLTSPKDERALADLAHQFLRERLGPHGILVAQEAEVQRGHATDLYVVRADSREPYGAARVVVEVKASWNPHLYPALENQLAAGYLDGVTRRYGIYLVGWYSPEGWYPLGDGVQHPKAKGASRGGIVALRAALDARARAHSAPDRHLACVVVDTSLPPARASA